MQSKSKPSSLDKLCPNLKLAKVASFNGTYQNTLKYWNGSYIYPMGSIVVIENEQGQSFLKGHDNHITSSALSRIDSILVTGQLPLKATKLYESPVIVWDLKSKKPIKSLEGLNQGIKQVVVSNNGFFIAASSKKNQLMVWNSKTLIPIFTKTYEKPINILAFEQDLIVSVDKALTQLHFGNSNVPNQGNFNLPSTGLSRNFICATMFSKIGYLIGTDGGEICVFQKNIFKSVSQIGKGKVMSIIVDGQFIFALVGDQIIKLQLNQGTLSQISKQKAYEGVSLTKSDKQSILLQAKSQIIRLNTNSFQSNSVLIGQSSSIVGLDLKGNVLAVAETQGHITIRDSKKFNIIGQCSYHKTSEITSISLGDNSQVFAGYIDGTIKCFKYQGPVSFQFEWNAHKQKVKTLQVNQNYIVSGGDDNVVRIWGRASRQLLGQIQIHQKYISKVLVDSKLSNYIHSSSMDKTIHTYDLKTDKKVVLHQVKNGFILDMDQSTGSGDIISVGINTPISYWNQNSPQSLGEIQIPTQLNCISISPSSKYFAVGGQTGDIYIFDLKTKAYLGKGQVHSSSVNKIKWINDISLVSGSQDSSLAFWNFVI